MVSVEEQLFLRCFFFGKKARPNNIPCFKFSFSECFFIEKRTPFTNRWENPLVFKQLQLTCSFKAKASIMCTCNQHRLGYRTACWHFRSFFEGLTLKQPHIESYYRPHAGANKRSVWLLRCFFCVAPALLACSLSTCNKHSVR